jgi:hypothetical protein
MATKRSADSSAPAPRVDVNDLAAAALESVHRAMAARATPDAKFPWRIIIGLILEPKNPKGGE